MAKNLRRNDKKASWRPSAGSACQWKRLVPKSRADEIPGRECSYRIGFDRSRDLERFRPDIHANAPRLCDSNRRKSNRPNSRAAHTARRTESEDRHAVAANTQAPITTVQ